MMKKITLLMLTILVAGILLLTSCSSKNVTVRVLDAEGKVICEETVKLGEENPDSITGETFYGIDCLEAALKKAKIEYYINKEDYEAFALTNVGDIACDKTNQFVYYVKYDGAKEFKNMNGLTAQHDEMEGGEILEFRFEALPEKEQNK